jgi:hypothetical protein
MNKIYISDLDGTLLRNDGLISLHSKNLLTELLDRGLIFTVASARSVVSIKSVLRGLKLNLPVVEFNGAFISDLDSGRHEFINYIEPDLVEDIYQLILDDNLLPFIASFNGKEDCLYYQEIINEGMLWYFNDRLQDKDRRLRKLVNLKDSFADFIVCLTVIGNLEIILELQNTIEQKFKDKIEIHLYENRYFLGWYWLTIHDRKATKDRAIANLVENYGLTQRELIVFGDHGNDISMFKKADRAIAVANAIDEVKELATEIIGANEEDSVVKYIYQNLQALN